MSLDVYLVTDVPQLKRQSSGIFIRENGATREIGEEEWRARFPEREPVRFVPDGEETTTTVYSANITHNLNRMAAEAGIYKALWRPDEIAVTTAAQLIPLLEAGLAELQARPDYFRQFNPENGWGDYEGLVQFVTEYLAACREFPTARVEVSR